ncbi:MAG: hypothetical protein JWN40_4141, partial [Phycisphaerales bacterium]|nr:hypothetical protein [Phycisphaerales bacterium]
MTTNNDDQLLQAFESLTLPFDQWTHRAHVKVAFTYLSRHPFPQALAKMRAGVQAYNARHNVPDTPTSGYNETTTHAFLHLIAATRAAYTHTRPPPAAAPISATPPHLLPRP